MDEHVDNLASGASDDAIALLLTPLGHLRLAPDAEAPPLPPELRDRLATAFARGAGHGLLQLGAAEVGSVLPPVLSWWRDFAARYVTALCATPADGGIAIVAPGTTALDALITDAPPMAGAEYLTAEVLTALWDELDAALRVELAASKQTLQDFLKMLHPAWNLIGRVHLTSPRTARMRMMKEYQSLSHTRWDCKYHVVFIPKRRKKRVFGALRRHLGELFHELASQVTLRVVSR